MLIHLQMFSKRYNSVTALLYCATRIGLSINCYKMAYNNLFNVNSLLTWQRRFRDREMDDSIPELRAVIVDIKHVDCNLKNRKNKNDKNKHIQKIICAKCTSVTYQILTLNLIYFVKQCEGYESVVDCELKLQINCNANSVTIKLMSSIIST